MIISTKKVFLLTCWGGLLCVASAWAGEQSTNRPQTLEQPSAQSPPSKPADPRGEQERDRHEDHNAHLTQENQPKQEMPIHHHGDIPVVKPETARLGKAQEQPTGPVYRLEELEQMALEHNPTLAQVAARLGSARSRRLQAGLYPNPRLGYAGEEIRGGAYGGGEHGAFVQQTFVTWGKLGLNRKIVDQDHDTEVLKAKIEEQETQVAVAMQQNMILQLWTTLATVVGNPTLEIGTVLGNLETDLPQLNEQELLDLLLNHSPIVEMAQAGLARSQAVLTRARREVLPEIEVKGGIQKNNQILDVTWSRVGFQAFAEVGVQLHILDRNQGNIAAARSDVESAQHELKRVDLMLRQRFAAPLQSYRNARIVVERYQNEILPSARKAYELMVKRYGLMTAAYPQVLNLQRKLYEIQAGYISTLEGLWTTSVALRGFLLEGGLAMPGPAGETEAGALPESSGADGVTSVTRGIRSSSPTMFGSMTSE